MYKVIEDFVDLQDNNFLYRTGDVYPRAEISIDAERYAELSSSNNRRGKPVIKLIPEAPKDNKVDITEEVEKPKKRAYKRKEKQ